MTTSTQPLVGKFTIDPIHSLFQFGVKHMGVSAFRASFEDVSGTVVADEQGIRLDGSVRVESLTIKQPDFRAHVLNGADFFDAPNHPELSFRSNDIKLREDGTAEVAGELTIKGITKPFTATGTYTPVVEALGGQSRFGVEFEAVVDRRDWDFTFAAQLPKGGDALANTVKLTANVEFVKEA